jgi:predicted permease
MLQDIRFALRQFAKTPGVTVAIVISLALGIAANAVVLSWLQRFVREPLAGVPRQHEIAVLVSNYGGGGVSLPDLRDFAAQTATFAGAFASMPTSSCLTVDRAPEWLQAQVVTANFFAVLEVKPILGRTFLPAEDQTPGGNPVLVISERLWRRRFEASPDVIGRVVDLNRHAFTIIGVMPEVFEGSMPPTRFDLWAPASMIWEVRNQERHFLTSRTARGWHNLVRLQPGIRLPAAAPVVATTDARLTQAYPRENRNAHHRLVPLAQCPWGAPTVVGPALRLLLIVSLGVQLIVTANVANLLLARAADRRREVAIRLASGASRTRILRQFLTESVVLAVLGGAAGLAVATWTVDSLFWLLLPAELKTDVPLTLRLDVTSAVQALGLTLLCGLLFGLAPALQAMRADVIPALKEGGRTGAAAHHRLRRALVVTEVALALVLLVGAGLCVRGLQRARQIDIGFRPDHVLLGRLQIGMNGYDARLGLPFYRELRHRVATQPGVEEAALASWFPLGLSGCKGTNVDVEGYPPRVDENPVHEFAIVSPRYFATLRLPLLAGRDFSDADTLDTERVAIVNEYFAQKFWPGLDPVGRRFRSGGAWRTVVGVARAGRYNRVDEAPHPFFYLPYLQGVPDLDLDVCVRTTGEPTAFAGNLRAVLRALDPGVELLRTTSLRSYSSMALFAQQLTSVLLTLLGAIALLLAAMGVYAVVAYAVAQRTQEFGVRIAVGAEPRRLLLQVLGEGLRLGLTGIAIGAALAFGVTRLLHGFLYGVSPLDPATFTAVAAILALVAIAACYLPARRAMRVDPIVALRAE